MPTPSDKELVTTRGWPAGIDNLNPENSLARDDKGNVIALRDARNVDLNRQGKAQRRAGYRKLVSSSGRMHSGWSDPAAFPLALLVDGGTMKAMRDDAVLFDVRADMGPADVSYAEAAGFAWWSSPDQHGRVSQDGDALEWGVEGPPGQPTLSVNAAGGLCAGRYQVAVTFLTAAGEESGTPQAALIDVPEGGGIRLDAIPQPRDGSQRIRAYMSPANGDMLYAAVDWPAGTTWATIGVHSAGRPLATQFLEPLPCGHIVRWQNGRLYVATGNTIAYSEALRYGLTNPAFNRIGFAADIALLEPVGAGTIDGGAGLFVAAAGKTYWTGGADPKAFNLKIAYPHGAVPGTSITVSGKVFGFESAAPVAYWLATNGVACIGLPGGEVVPLRENQAVAPAASAGASLFRDTGSFRQVITTLVNAAPRGLAMQDKLECEVYRDND